MFRSLYGHLHGGKSKNTDIFIMYQDQSTNKNRTVLVKILVNWQNSWNCNHNCVIFNCGTISIYYGYICMLVVTTLKMATPVVETCRGNHVMNLY
jgi:hypothetical protein